MATFHCALVQVNTVVGAIPANANKLARLAWEAAGAGAGLVVFPELALSGYPPEDLVLKRHFVEDCRRELERMAAGLPAGPVVVVGLPVADGERVYNGAAVIQNGAVRAWYRKMLLPNYGVFDEKRVFEAGARPLVLDMGGLRIGLHICEDSWLADGAPCAGVAAARPDAVVNLSASPFDRGKGVRRVEAMARCAAAIRAPVLCCNLVGGQDELVFDGASFAVAPSGAVLARARSFAEEILQVPLAVGGAGGAAPAGVDRVELAAPPPAKATELPAVAPLPDDLEAVYAALTLGLRDYADKNGFERAVVAVSGGIDSALVLALAVDALGVDRVRAVTMPSGITSSETLADARRVAENFGVDVMTVPIRALHEQYVRELAPLWPGREADTTEENLQARIRGNIVMALSNKFGWLVLTTGNKSELATGYCTLYGDMAGGFAVIKDVPKTLVFALARRRNERAGRDLIPQSILDRPPTAELKPGQRDQDTLPPYEVLDAIIERYVERDLGADQIIAEGFDPAVVRRTVRMIDGNEYKRRQGPPGIKITPKAFGRDRRLPITNLYHERVKQAGPEARTPP